MLLAHGMTKSAESIAFPAASVDTRGIGGTLDLRQRRVEAELVRTYTGITRFSANHWGHCRAGDWVLDIINHGCQPQRIGRGKSFTRLSGVAALYAPQSEYHEWREAGHSIDESWITFRLHGELERHFRALAGRKAYCHFRDPDHLIAERLREIGELSFHRRTGFHVQIQGLFLSVLGDLVASEADSSHLRTVRKSGVSRKGSDLRTRVEQYIRAHITEPMRVDDLARHLGLSRSVLAHRYPRLVGESPYRTVQLLKVETAKRLILKDGLSVKECATRLGFSSEFHFSRLFKRLEGIAPRDYRHALTKSQIVRSPGVS